MKKGKAKPRRFNHRAGAKSSKTPYVTAVVANEAGEIFDLEGFAAVGRQGPLVSPLPPSATLPLPDGSELMRLPDRMPLLYDLDGNRIVVLPENPYMPGEVIYPVAAFNSPGYVLTAVSAFEEKTGADYLPLFSYGAVGWHGGHFRSGVIKVDDEPRQDLRLMPLDQIQEGIKRMRRELPENRLRKHLEKCALTYGCPAGKNFFLSRYEAPLPTSTSCNARCLGCISLQSEGCMPHSQDRIAFLPTPMEIAEVALAHINKVRCAVVSFGQGCEGDPLMMSDTICEAIQIIRSKTGRGTIHMNTNGSLPAKIEQLLAAGLDSLRISMNSVRRPCYEAYFRPKGYAFKDVLSTLDTAARHGAYIAINYLNCPGFTDTPEEMEALLTLLRDHPLQMIQWRNLNFDPLRYLDIMNRVAGHSMPLGMRHLLDEVHRQFPEMRYGYFNPAKETF